MIKPLDNSSGNHDPKMDAWVHNGLIMAYRSQNSTQAPYAHIGFQLDWMRFTRTAPDHLTSCGWELAFGMPLVWIKKLELRLQNNADAAPRDLCPAWNDAEETMDKTMEILSISVSLHRRPTNLGALVDVFGKPLGLFLPHQVVVLESPLGLFSLFRLAMKKTRTRCLDPWCNDPSKSNIEISNAQQIETDTLEMKIESTHVARALFIAWKYLSGRHFVLWDLLVCDTVGMAWNLWTIPFWHSKKNNKWPLPWIHWYPKMGFMATSLQSLGVFLVYFHPWRYPLSNPALGIHPSITREKSL